MLRKAGGVAALAAAGFLILRGALPIAIPLAVFGLALIRRGAAWVGGTVRLGSQDAGTEIAMSSTEKLEMELDHDSGQMDGTCLSGRFAGRALSSLSDGEVDGAARRAPSRRRAGSRVDGGLSRLAPAGLARSDEDSEPSRAGARGAAGPRSNRMSAEEAYAVLGIGRGASEEDIRQAHRRLMMKMHPDQGGSTYLAARINEAKEVLLGE